MLRIHFTHRDLARITISTQPDLRWEVMSSRHVLQASADEPMYGSWRRRTLRLISAPRAKALLDDGCGG